jgi:tRNA(Arg) A34 adenosine deaminase TadA
MTDDEKYILTAIVKAKEGIDKGQSPFAACIVKDDEIIACEHNTVWENTDITSHAEIIAIRKACKLLNNIDLTGCVIYSTCEPCPMCFTACHWANISRIVFGARIEDSKAFGFSELCVSNKVLKEIGKSKIGIVSDILRQENIELFQYWKSKNGKKAY